MNGIIFGGGAGGSFRTGSSGITGQSGAPGIIAISYKINGNK
ncbi:MAG: hypothetical protein ACYCWE_21185 [Eubacteriales bacterium]